MYSYFSCLTIFVNKLKNLKIYVGIILLLYLLKDKGKLEIPEFILQQIM